MTPPVTQITHNRNTVNTNFVVNFISSGYFCTVLLPLKIQAIALDMQIIRFFIKIGSSRKFAENKDKGVFVV